MYCDHLCFSIFSLFLNFFKDLFLFYVHQCSARMYVYVRALDPLELELQL